MAPLYTDLGPGNCQPGGLVLAWSLRCFSGASTSFLVQLDVRSTYDRGSLAG